MGRQIELYLTNDDLNALRDVVAKLGPVSLLGSRWRSPVPERLDDLRIHHRGKEPWKVFLCREPDVSEVRLRFVENQNFWSVDEGVSPVIEVDRPYFDGSVCTRGRIYYVPGYYDGETLVKQPEAFL